MPLDRKQVVLTAFQRLDRTGRGRTMLNLYLQCIIQIDLPGNLVAQVFFIDSVNRLFNSYYYIFLSHLQVLSLSPRYSTTLIFLFIRP